MILLIILSFMLYSIILVFVIQPLTLFRFTHVLLTQSLTHSFKNKQLMPTTQLITSWTTIWIMTITIWTITWIRTFTIRTITWVRTITTTMTMIIMRSTTRTTTITTFTTIEWMSIHNILSINLSHFIWRLTIILSNSNCNTIA